MNNEEKILAMLAQMQGQMGQMQEDISGLKVTQDKIGADISGLKDDVSGLKITQDKMGERLDAVAAKQDAMGEDLHCVKAYLELDVEKRFDAVNLGINIIQKKLEQMDDTREKVKTAQDDIVVLKTAVRALARDVAELKKAQ